LSGMRYSVKTILKRSGVLEHIGEENCFDSTEEGIKASLEQLNSPEKPSAPQK